MARTLRREWYDVPRNADTVYHIVPIGDVHDGTAACDEKLLQQVVARIEADPMCYWIGMGDYCEFINIHDKRFDPGILASWIGVADLVDLAEAQRDHFLSIIKPIASKCLGLVCGNHEGTILRKFERDIYREIVVTIKGWGGFPNDHDLAFGVYGWLQLCFCFGPDKHAGSTVITGNIHHGFTGGRLGGAKALNMERWLWTHDCDFALFGHSHNADIYRRAVEYTDRYGHIKQQVRLGGYAGTFMRTVNDGGPPTYTEWKGYLPQPIGGIELELRPGLQKGQQMVRMTL